MDANMVNMIEWTASPLIPNARFGSLKEWRLFVGHDESENAFFYSITNTITRVSEEGSGFALSLKDAVVAVDWCLGELC